MRSHLKSSNLKTIGLILSLVVGATATPLTTPANAYLQEGWFHLRGTVRDEDGGGALRALDITRKDGEAGHFLKLNTTLYAKDSQLWRERYPRTGTIDVIRLQNKETGLCVAHSGLNAIASLEDCTSDTTLWQKIPMSDHRVVLRIEVNGTTKCLGKEREYPGLPVILDCSNGWTDKMVWQAYVSG